MLETSTKKDKKYYIVPAAITYLNMSFGGMAILISITTDIKKMKIGSILLLLAAITDKLDGFIARKYGMTSEFGKELDSLCDLVSFGIAPIIIGWNVGIKDLGIVGGIGALIFIGSGIFRLARFNVEEENRYIIGLPITIGGGIMSIKYIIDITYRLRSNNPIILSYENIILIIIISILMISNIRFKKPDILN